MSKTERCQKTCQRLRSGQETSHVIKIYVKVPTWSDASDNPFFKSLKVIDWLPY